MSTEGTKHETDSEVGKPNIVPFDAIEIGEKDRK